LFGDEREIYKLVCVLLMMKYKFMKHTADIKFKAYGKTMNEAFCNVILAMSDYFGKGNNIEAVKRKKIKVEGDDAKSLLYNFLDELIYLVDAERFVVAGGKVKIKNGNLVGELWGDDVKNYKGLDHVKAATYSEMFVGKKKGKWEIVAVVDV
jgi:SHS2 domain-containing protein